jgi:hypothetical protein
VVYKGHLLIAFIAAWSIDQIQKDVGAMMEELLVKTLPPADDKKELATK